MKFRYSLFYMSMGKTNVLTVTQVLLISCRALSILSTSLLLLNLNTFARPRTHSLLLTSLSLSIFFFGIIFFPVGSCHQLFTLVSYHFYQHKLFTSFVCFSHFYHWIVSLCFAKGLNKDISISSSAVFLLL